MESDDDYYTVSECLSSKVSSYGSCTPVASDQDEEVGNKYYVHFNILLLLLWRVLKLKRKSYSINIYFIIIIVIVLICWHKYLIFVYIQIELK